MASSASSGRVSSEGFLVSVATAERESGGGVTHGEVGAVKCWEGKQVGIEDPAGWWRDVGVRVEGERMSCMSCLSTGDRCRDRSDRSDRPDRSDRSDWEDAEESEIVAVQ